MITVSTTDVLISWLAFLFGPQIGAPGYAVIEYMFNLRKIVRTMSNAYFGSVISVLLIDITNDADDLTDAANGPRMIAHTASRIRRTINRLKSDNVYVEEWLAVSAHFILKLASKGFVLWPSRESDQLYVNAWSGFDLAATFGFPKDEVRFHCEERPSRGAGIKLANLAKGQLDSQRGVEIDLVIEVENYEALEAKIKEERQEWQQGTHTD